MQFVLYTEKTVAQSLTAINERMHVKETSTRPALDGWVARETLPPQRVAENRDVGPVRSIVVSVKVAADERRHAQRVEEARASSGTRALLRRPERKAGALMPSAWVYYQADGTRGTAARATHLAAKALAALGSSFVYGGDVYDSGSEVDFAVFDSVFGDVLPLLAETPGNHDWNDPGVQGYEQYWLARQPQLPVAPPVHPLVPSGPLPIASRTAEAYAAGASSQTK